MIFVWIYVDWYIRGGYESIYLSLTTFRRLFTTAILLAEKYLSLGVSGPRSNYEYAGPFDISIAIFNLLEVRFLLGINFNLSVNPKEYLSFTMKVERYRIPVFEGEVLSFDKIEAFFYFLLLKSQQNKNKRPSDGGPFIRKFTSDPKSVKRLPSINSYLARFSDILISLIHKFFTHLFMSID